MNAIRKIERVILSMEALHKKKKNKVGATEFWSLYHKGHNAPLVVDYDKLCPASIWTNLLSQYNGNSRNRSSWFIPVNTVAPRSNELACIKFLHITNTCISEQNPLILTVLWINECRPFRTFGFKSGVFASQITY